MSKTVICIPLQSGSHIYLSNVDLNDNTITYRRGFNPQQSIKEDFEIIDGMVRTALIFFPSDFAAKWLKSNEND